MNYKDYKNKKINGVTEVIKVGGAYAFASKRYNIETGVAETPEIEAVDTKILNDRKTELQDEIISIDDILLDIKNLEEVK